MDKGKIVSGLIVLGLLLVIFFSVREHLGDENPHPPTEVWLTKHPRAVENTGNPEKYCLKCHSKYGHTMENYCNSCHQAMGVGK